MKPDDSIDLNRWSVPYLFPYQELVIRRLLDRDSVRQAVILPTGAGKSLCFQLPAVHFPFPTLVIYPLRSLTADQKRRSDQAGVRSWILQGGQTRAQRQELWTALEKGMVQVLLSNPETLLQPEVLERLCRHQFSHVVVDEAHCVELWGNAFRPSYRRLSTVLERLKCRRMTAFTATASQRIVEDWGGSLFGTSDFDVVRASADRPNLDLAHEPVLSLRRALPRTIARESRPALVFCRSREHVRRWAHHLHLTTAFDVRFYHAGLTKEEKTAVERWFFGSADGVLVATNAYGMGVDKPDIRTVVHVGSPPTKEDYWQEAGRAGRDGGPARALLLTASEAGFSPSRCRRQAILETFAEVDTACSGCDVCRGQDAAPPADVGPAIRALAPWVHRLDRDEVRALLMGRSRDPDQRLPCASSGSGLWREEDDQTAHELWSGLENGGWVRFHRSGPWKGLLAPLAVV